MEQETQEQSNNRPWLYKKGQSGNPGGRPKGSKTMKAYVAERLALLPDDKREEFLDGLSKEVVWKMAEGAPDAKTDITSKGEKITIPDSKALAIAKEYEEKLKKNL